MRAFKVQSRKFKSINKYFLSGISGEIFNIGKQTWLIIMDQLALEYNWRIKSKMQDLFIELHQLPAFSKYYSSIELLYNSLLHQPVFMFIGINPGAGYWNECLQDTEPDRSCCGLA